MRKTIKGARQGEKIEEMEEFEEYLRGNTRNDGSETTNDGNEQINVGVSVEMDDGEPKMCEDELDDEWERIIREDEEEMARALENTWLEDVEYMTKAQEYKEVRDRFGDG